MPDPVHVPGSAFRVPALHSRPSERTPCGRAGRPTEGAASPRTLPLFPAGPRAVTLWGGARGGGGAGRREAEQEGAVAAPPPAAQAD